MADNSLTIDRNRFLALVLKSPTQMGWLSIINSVTNISRLGTFNVTEAQQFFNCYFVNTQRCQKESNGYFVTANNCIKKVCPC